MLDEFPFYALIIHPCSTRGLSLASNELSYMGPGTQYHNKVTTRLFAKSQHLGGATKLEARINYSGSAFCPDQLVPSVQRLRHTTQYSVAHTAHEHHTARLRSLQMSHNSHAFTFEAVRRNRCDICYMLVLSAPLRAEVSRAFICLIHISPVASSYPSWLALVPYTTRSPRTSQHHHGRALADLASLAPSL